MILLAATAVVAQQSSSSSSDTVVNTARNIAGRQSKNLISAAEEMPAGKYSYKPTEQQMSFGKLVSHIVESNNFMCAKLTSQAAPPENVKNTDSKDKLVTALKASFDYCDTALKNLNDKELSEPVTLWGGRQANKAAALIGLTNDWADHYAAAAIYLRLNGMLPPTAKHEQTSAKKD